MGLKSRVKGKVFERVVARILREAFPEYAESIRRSDQGHGAADCDVTGLPGLWFECEDAASPNPAGKLAQAIGDAPSGRMPIAVTHKKGARRIKASLRLSDLVRIWLLAAESHAVHSMVTLDLADLLALLKVAHPRLAAVSPESADA